MKNKNQKQTKPKHGAAVACTDWLGDDRESIQWTPKQLAAAMRVGSAMSKIFPSPKPIMAKSRIITVNGRKLKVA